MIAMKIVPAAKGSGPYTGGDSDGIHAALAEHAGILRAMTSRTNQTMSSLEGAIGQLTRKMRR